MMPERFRFDSKRLKALPARERAYRVYDTGERHLGLEVAPSGRKRFFVRRRPAPDAPPRQWNLGEFPATSVARARDIAYEINGQIARGEIAAPTVALKVFWEVYETRHLCGLSQATQRAYREAWQTLAPLHRRQLADITRADVARMHGELGQQSRTWADKVRATLSSILGRAVEWGYLDQLPPMPRPFGSVKRERWLTRDELGRLLAAVDQEPDPLPDLVRLLLFTGARKREACRMRWDELRLDGALWMRPQKGGAIAPTALPAAAVAILEDRRRRLAAEKKYRSSPWVFPSVRGGGPIVTPDKHWRAARERANLPDVRLHDLRHTHASWMAQAGVSLQIIGAQLGHRQTSTTERYAHLAIDPQRKAVDMVAERMMGESA